MYVCMNVYTRPRIIYDDCIISQQGVPSWRVVNAHIQIRESSNITGKSKCNISPIQTWTRGGVSPGENKVMEAVNR